MSNVAFIGLGNMGSGMCANLVKADHSVKAFDLNPQAIEQAISSGASGAQSIAECVAHAEYVITMLPAGKHVHSVYFDQGGITRHAEKSAVLIDCSTIAVSEARDIATQAHASGYAVVDAPVSGGVAAANKLEDYEEGTFTPAATSQTGAITSYTSSGYYTKIGRSVTVSMTITLTNVGTAAGVLRFGNLIFATDSAGPWTAVVRENNNTGNIYYGQLQPSGTYMQAATDTNSGIAWTNGNVYAVSLTYTTAS